MTVDKIEYKPNRKTALLSLVMAPVFVAGSIFMWSDDGRPSTGRRRPIGTAIAKFLGVPFGIFIGIYAIQKLLDNKPALVLSPEGIECNISAVGLKKTKWSNIQSIELKPDGMLYFSLIDEKDGLNNDNVAVKATNMLSKSMAGTSATIALKHGVDGDPVAVTNTIVEYWEKYSGYTNVLNQDGMPQSNDNS